MKKVILAADHAGFQLKEAVKAKLLKRGVEVVDLGPTTDQVPVSYALQGAKLAHQVVDAQSDEVVGIGFCGTGLGISMAVNRIDGARGARVTSIEDAHLARQHNNANVLLLGGRQMKVDKAMRLVDEFDHTKFEGGRHLARINQLDTLGKLGNE